MGIERCKQRWYVRVGKERIGQCGSEAEALAMELEAYAERGKVPRRVRREEQGLGEDMYIYVTRGNGCKSRFFRVHVKDIFVGYYEDLTDAKQARDHFVDTGQRLGYLPKRPARQRRRYLPNRPAADGWLP